MDRDTQTRYMFRYIKIHDDTMQLVFPRQKQKCTRICVSKVLNDIWKQVDFYAMVYDVGMLDKQREIMENLDFNIGANMELHNIWIAEKKLNEYKK